MSSVDSASDNRTVNNAMRHQYRVLNDGEKKQMTDVKDLGLAFIKRLHEIDVTRDDEPLGSVDLRIAETKITEAVMWAVRHITQ